MKTPLYFLRSTLFVASAAVISMSANSVPLIDASLTAGQWQPDYTGDLGVGDNTASLEELGFSDDSHNVITAVLKHPVPIIPNIRISINDISTDGSGTLVRNFEFDDITYQANENVEAELDISFNDFTLFYSPLNNWVQIDFGLTGRQFDAQASATGSVSGTETAVFDDWIPLLYLGARFELPLSGLFADGRLNAISYDGNKVSDVSVALGYAFDLPAAKLTTELGYRNFTFVLDDNDNDIGADIELDGLYLSLGIQF